MDDRITLRCVLKKYECGQHSCDLGKGQMTAVSCKCSKEHARFQASAAMLIRSSGTTYQSHLRGSTSSRKKKFSFLLELLDPRRWD
jgi:hypothetical protein